MKLHDVVAFGAGFGCGALWLGFAFMFGHRLRHCQPPEALDLLREDGVNQSATPDPGAAHHHTSLVKVNLRRVLLWAFVMEEYVVVALVMLRHGWSH